MLNRDSLRPANVNPPAVPGWAVPRAPVDDPIEAAYLAGAAMTSLDNLLRSEPGWAGAWRQRMALKAAAATARLLGRREDEAALRDLWHLRQPGAAAGPAGDILAAWRRLGARSPAIDVDGLRSLTGLLGLAWSDGLETVPAILDETTRSTKPAPMVAAEVADAIAALAPKAESLAWWCADLALARRMRWPMPVPVLASQIHAPILRSGADRRRLRPGDKAFAVAACLATAVGAAEACRLAGEIARSAHQLAAVAPKLRTKGAGEVIQLLLDDDAVSGSLTTQTLSRWATRRLFERLCALDAVRELTGRPAFRLYGL